MITDGLLEIAKLLGEPVYVMFFSVIFFLFSLVYILLKAYIKKDDQLDKAMELMGSLHANQDKVATLLNILVYQRGK